MPRSLAEQSVEELGGPRSVLARQRRDHKKIDDLMRAYGSAEEDALPALWKELTQLVFSHAFAEETVLWPAVRRLVPEGETLTGEVEVEHQQINDLLHEIERSGTDGAGHAERVQRAFSLISADVRDEEDHLLPRLQEVCSQRDLQRLGLAWEVSRRTAPTRPHPRVPRRPPANAVCGVPLTVYDRGRDLISPFGRRRPARVGALLAVAATVVWGAGKALRRRS